MKRFSIYKTNQGGEWFTEKDKIFYFFCNFAVKYGNSGIYSREIVFRHSLRNENIPA